MSSTITEQPTPTSDEDGIRQAITVLLAAGYVLAGVDDGDADELVKVTDTEDAVKAITAVDDAYLMVTHPTERGSHVRFVMGNDPDEVVCDYGLSLSHVLDPLIDRWIELAA